MNRKLYYAAIGCLSVACSQRAANEPNTSKRAPAPQIPEDPIESPSDLDSLLTDVMAAKACDRMAGSFTGLSASGSADLIEGRLWIEECSGEDAGDEARLTLGGRGWRWIDRTKEKLGATFSVSQYVRMQVDLGLTGGADYAYDQEAKVLNVWLVHAPPVKADVRPLEPFDVEPKGAWGTLLGSAATLIGMSPESEAEQTLEKKASRKLTQKLRRGFSLAVNLCTGQTYSKLGDIKEGELPDKPYPSPNRIWIQNARVRLHPSGIDLAGPMQPDNDKLVVEIRAEEGPPVRARLICEDSARRVANAFLDGQPLPTPETLAESTVTPNSGPVALAANTSRCPAVLLTTPAPQAGSADRPARFAFMAYAAEDRPEALVPCKGQEQGGTVAAGSP